MDKKEWNVRLLNSYRVTIDILERIKNETPYKYKKLETLSIKDSLAGPVWTGINTDMGNIDIGYNNDPESIAHELGHGLHEKIRETGKENFIGEEFCEIIRYYVEKQLNPKSLWINNVFNSQMNPFEKYSKLDIFIQKLNNGQLFAELNWK